MATKALSQNGCITVNIVQENPQKVKEFFDKHNSFRTIQCQTITGFWGKRSANHVAEHAERYKQIQVNSGQITQCLAFDIDHDDPMIFTDYNLPTPTIITLNQNNGRSHFLYYLKSPVNTYSDRAKRYLSDVYDTVANTLQADPNYSTHNTKNFLNTDLYRVYGSLETRELADFREFLSTSNAWQQKEKRVAISRFSRNCELFDTVRFYAYSVKRDFTSYDGFYNHVQNKAQETNIGLFANPLSHKEVKDTAKSISKWTWENERPGQWNWNGYIKKNKCEVSAIRSKTKKLDRLKIITARLSRRYDMLQSSEY